MDMIDIMLVLCTIICAINVIAMFTLHKEHERKIHLLKRKHCIEIMNLKDYYESKL